MARGKASEVYVNLTCFELKVQTRCQSKFGVISTMNHECTTVIRFNSLPLFYLLNYKHIHKFIIIHKLSYVLVLTIDSAQASL